MTLRRPTPSPSPPPIIQEADAADASDSDSDNPVSQDFGDSSDDGDGTTLISRAEYGQASEIPFSMGQRITVGRVPAYITDIAFDRRQPDGREKAVLTVVMAGDEDETDDDFEHDRVATAGLELRSLLSSIQEEYEKRYSADFV